MLGIRAVHHVRAGSAGEERDSVEALVPRACRQAVGTTAS